MLLPYSIDYEQKRDPWITLSLLAVNALVFIGGLFLTQNTLELIFYRFGFVPQQVNPVTLITYMFLHAGWLHILGNMYYIWMFGRAVEDRMGPVKFFVFYLCCGIVAMAVHLMVTRPEVTDLPCIGASGAVSGILGAFLAMHPTTKVSCIVLFMDMRPVGATPIHAWFVLGIWFLLQLIMHAAMGASTGAQQVAYAAHIGGFLFGWLSVGGVGILREIKRDWGAIQWSANLKKAAREISAGRQPDPELADDLIVRKMLFLKNGAEPDNEQRLGQWIHNLDERADAAVIASLGLRAHGKQGQLNAHHLCRVARCLAKLGQMNASLSLLMERLQSADDKEAQALYFELGHFLLERLKDKATAQVCYEQAIALDHDKNITSSARYKLREIDKDMYFPEMEP